MSTLALEILVTQYAVDKIPDSFWLVLMPNDRQKVLMSEGQPGIHKGIVKA